MNLINNLDEFDEESKNLLSSISAFGKVLNFQNQTAGNLQSIRTGGPDYRSPFHDYRNTPLGYSYLTDSPVSVFPFTGINERGEKGYEYRAEVLPCKNGSQVLGSYNNNKREPQSLFLFYEEPDPEKSNFAGDFYIAKMGEYFKQLFQRKSFTLPSKINGKPFMDITSMKDEAIFLTQLAYTYEGDKIDATLVHQALMREYQFLTGDKRFEEIIGGISSIPADAIGWCAEQLESLKPTETNYNPELKDYSPLIPIVIGGAVIPVPVNMNKAAQFFENLGNNPFVQGAEVAFSKVWIIVQQAASKVKDASIEHLPDAFRKLVVKISDVINDIKVFLTEVKDHLTELAKQGIELLKVANAFYCGINNGLVSLIQCILYILQFLLQPTKVLSYEQYKERRDLLEKAEDVLDWATENVPVFLQGVKDLLKGDPSLADMGIVLDKLKEYFGNISPYTKAFYAGIIAFEVLINILLFFFTGGVGNVIKGETYVAKIVSLLKVVTRESISAVTMGITDVLTFLSNFIVRFGKACARGFKGFIDFIEELLQGVKNGAKAEELVEEVHDLEGIILKSPSKLSIQDLIKILLKNNINDFYNLSQITLIAKRGQQLNMKLEDIIGFVKTGNIKEIKTVELLQQMDNYIKIVLKRGYPFGFNSLKDFERFCTILKDELSSIGLSIEDIRVQGSSLRKIKPKDLDLAVFINDVDFNNYLRKAFDGKIKLNGEVVNISKMGDSELMKLTEEIFKNDKTNAVSRTFAFALQNRKISGLTKPRIIKRHREVIEKLNTNFKNLRIDDISIQTKGGKLELKPDLKIK